MSEAPSSQPPASSAATRQEPEPTAPMEESSSSLSFAFRNRRVPVSLHPSVGDHDVGCRILNSEPFTTWVRRCERKVEETNQNADLTTTEKWLELHSVEIQSVDFFGARGVGFVKLKSHCTLVEETTTTTNGGDNQSSISTNKEVQHYENALPGICFLRGSAVSVLVVLFVQDDDDKNQDSPKEAYVLLTDQPRVPIGQVSCLELPAGMLDDANESISGTVMKELQEECGISLNRHGSNHLVDLTELACQEAVEAGNMPEIGIPPSPGGCDELVRYFYLEKLVSRAQLDALRGRLTGLREQHGEYITLRVVPLSDVWKVSADGKAMISLFLLNQLREQGTLPPAGELATPLLEEEHSVVAPATLAASDSNSHCKDDEPTLPLHVIATNRATPTTKTTLRIPRLAFGLYKVPATDEGQEIMAQAIRAGYRHFDGASIYGNEVQLGRAIKASGVPRSHFFITGKVWNDAVQEGRAAVRASVEKSLAEMGIDYFDLYLIHWPVPNRCVDAYKELEVLHEHGKIRALGLSNFNRQEYEQLINSGISILPATNQLETSAVLYPADLINYFQSQQIVVCAFKPLNRASDAAFKRPELVKLAEKYDVSPAQIMLRWAFQKDLVVIAKTATPSRMLENRSVKDRFVLSAEDMSLLDSLTSKEDLEKRKELEALRKTSW